MIVTQEEALRSVLPRIMDEVYRIAAKEFGETYRLNPA